MQMRYLYGGGQACCCITTYFRFLDAIEKKKNQRYSPRSCWKAVYQAEICPRGRANLIQGHYEGDERIKTFGTDEISGDRVLTCGELAAMNHD